MRNCVGAGGLGLSPSVVIRLLGALALILTLASPWAALAQDGQSMLKVKAPIDGVQVILDGEEVGVTPLIRMVDPGTHRVRLLHPHYDEYRQTFDMVAGQAVTIDAPMTSVLGILLVTTTADPATVFVDGEEVGQTPDLLLDELVAGEHDVRVERPGYLTYSGRVRIQAGLKLKLNVQLRANAAEVTLVTTPPGAAVEIDGEAMGETPLTLPTVTGGSHALRLTIPGRSTVIRAFQVRVGDQIKIEAEIPEEGGRLTVKSNQDGAAVYLDGYYVGDTPLKLEDLAPGPYSIRLSEEGFADATDKARVAAGRRERVKVRMMSEEDFDKAGYSGDRDRSDKRLVERWWFWTLTGAVVLGGAGGGAWWYLSQGGGGVTPGDVPVTLP